MQKKARKTLGKSISFGCVAFIILLCVVLSIINQATYRRGLINRYKAHIRDILTFTRTQIDTDDLARCIETGVKSEGYHKLQQFMDTFKDSADIHYLYVIRPLNTEPVDNVMDIIAAMSSYEKAYMPEMEVTLCGLTGEGYSVASVTKYLQAAETSDISFFVSDWVKGATYIDYTGTLPLYTSTGRYIGLLCVDIDISEIRKVVLDLAVNNILLILALGLVFIALFIIWAHFNITNPIRRLENNVTNFAAQHKGKEDVDSIVIASPDIRTGNEIELLADAFVQMSQDMKTYVEHVIEAESHARFLNELANKDMLTSVRNKTAYDSYEKKLNEMIAAEKIDFAVVMTDLNNLKKINDTYGHERGNEYIKMSCNLICHVFTHSPVFRIGGDEFVVILTGEDFANRKVLYEEATVFFRNTSENQNVEPWQRFSAAIGMADFCPDTDSTLSDVFNRADAIMYQNKAAMKADWKE